MKPSVSVVGLILGAVLAAAGQAAAGQGRPAEAPAPPPLEHVLGSTRAAIADLTKTFGRRYGRGAEFLNRLEAVERAAARPAADRRRELQQLQRDALLANPLLDFGRLLVIKRRPRGKAPTALGFPSNHECNSSLERLGYDNEIAVLPPARPEGAPTTLYRPPGGGYVGEMDLHWDGDRLLFTQSDGESWKVWEIRIDGTGLRQVTKAPADVDCFDACYLPNGRIVFGSTASYQSVPCWHGQKRVSNLYAADADGAAMRQLCFDQDHNFHPVILPDGQVLYHRWDYTGINHIFMRQLMVMNPDGMAQRAIYGSNAWFPNSLYFPRPVPGRPGQIVCILSGYHGVHRMGQLVIVDAARGGDDTERLIRRISGRGDPIRPIIRDNLVDEDWPKFLHPWPLHDPAAPASAGKYFLVACQEGPGSPWGVYLADVFDNLVLLRAEPPYALLEPVPLARTARPPILPDRVEAAARDGVVYLHDIHAGDGLAGVPRGTIKSLRVIAYHFACRDLGGPDLVGRGGPWEVMRILGSVPLEADGSACFRAPANTPLAVQALDGEGKAVQLMRSWFTLMPGESASCVGCHERPAEAPRSQLALAMRPPREITPWRGPPRGFDFRREVQPVLDRHCAGCHDGSQPARRDLRDVPLVPDYAGTPLSKLGIQRQHPALKAATGGIIRYGPAYDALLPYLRRVGIEDDVSLLTPGEFHADTSPLIQLLRKGHQGAALDEEAWDRLVTWIDLNAPCHGTWGEVFGRPIPDGGHERRMELRRLYGGPADDPEAIPPGARTAVPFAKPAPLPPATPVRVEGWPFDAREARRRQAAAGGPVEKAIDLGGGVTMKLIRIPAGRFVMGDPNGPGDERLPADVEVAGPFWMGACEVTNAHFRVLDPAHDCRYYGKRHARPDDQGLPLNAPDQPAVRVSWDQATAFCQWLSQRTGLGCSLPTEAQWEYACRAGSDAAMAYGAVDADFSAWANMADRSFGPTSQATGGLEHLVMEGADLAELRFDDKAVVTAPVGSYRPNAWGLHDMHGNAAEWTSSPAGAADPRRVVRGGSFFDPPRRCRAAARLAYPPWQRVFNVGFRIICQDD